MYAYSLVQGNIIIIAKFSQAKQQISFQTGIIHYALGFARLRLLETMQMELWI